MGRPDDSGTWHYGLVARWWAEFNEPEEQEVDYLRSAIERYGQPALDVGCGTGRILVPLLRAGMDVDGADVSADMVAFARQAARAAGFGPTLAVQGMHELDLPRRYRTIFSVGTWGLGGSRERDREGLWRMYAHLEPGAVLLINHELPYEGLTEEVWGLWLADQRRAALPRPWPESGMRKRAADGDEIELLTRTVDLDPMAQVQTLEIRARLWHDGAVAREETGRILINLYFVQETVDMLRAAGFDAVEVEGGYTGQPATPDDGVVMFVARKPG